MKVRLEFHPDAVAEVESSMDWYEGQRAGLGDEFFAELRQGLQVIAESPRVNPPWTGGRVMDVGVRRLRMERFPFVLPYLVVEDLVVVLAVAHVRRRPGYWLPRARSFPQR
ncbi:type II toxin-antitoxin system RelE/ParE family toxin [Myxococcus guangdongensis]|uniref:type II toxin-antitoxin system RelE/ParE family toxin n=1 Tax=Myxococcus guangdongensis TaxID=2906760 RepID=UPI0038991262